MPNPAASDRIEIIGPDGQVTFYALDPAQGLTNVGSHPDNDIVLEGAGIAPFQAVIDHRHKPYQLLRLGTDHPTDPPVPLNNWDALTFEGYTLIYLDGDGVETPPGEAADATSGESIDTATAELVSPGEVPVEALEPPLPAANRVEAEPPAPATAALPPLEQKLETEPKPAAEPAPEEKAPALAPLLVPAVGAAQAAPPEPSALTQATTPKPSIELAVTEITPRPQKIFWSQASTRLAMTVTNTGNTETCVDISGEDEQHFCQIEFQTAAQAPWQPKQAEVRLAPGQTQPIAIRLTPLARQLAGLGPRLHFFTVTVAPQASERGRRAVLGQVRQYPLLGGAALFLLALILLGLLPWLFRPTLYEFSAAPGQITGGQTATLRWSAAPLSTLHISPEVGWVSGLNGQQSVTPKHDTVYTLTAENIFTGLNPELFRATRTTTVLVDPVLPRMRLTVDQETVPAGGLVTLSWQVLNATDLVLIQNGIPETIPPEQHASGQRLKAIPGETTFSLVAHNEYTPPEGITATVTVRLQGAPVTPTAAGLPVIEKFDVSPAEIFAGEPVRLEWAVSGVDGVTISPEPGASAPSGAVVLRPQQTTTYSLSASKNGVPLQLVKQVVVKPAPPASSTDEAPVIDSFTATPAQATPDSAEAQHIVIAWSISGNVTQVEISRPGVATVPGLPAQGTLEVAVAATTTFTLVAHNGEAVASKTVSVQISASLPSLISLSPAALAAGDPAFTLVVNGSGFARTSVIWWNGTARPTTYINSSQLTAAITAADIAQAASVAVSVVTPAPGGGTSAPLTLAVTNPLPIITSLNPGTAQVGGPAFALEINGTGFNGQSQVRWNGTVRVVSILSATKLTVLIPASDIATPGTSGVSVVNAGPGGGSAGAAFVVAAAPTATPTPTPTPTATVIVIPTPTATATPTETATVAPGGQALSPAPQ